MKVFILVLLIAAVFIDIGSSKPTHSRKKRQLAGTGVALGQYKLNEETIYKILFPIHIYQPKNKS